MFAKSAIHELYQQSGGGGAYPYNDPRNGGCIDLILSTVVQACKGAPPGRTGHTKKTLNAKEKAKQEADSKKTPPAQPKAGNKGES